MNNLLIICLLLLSADVSAQNLYTISGKVVDKNTKAPLQGASVFAQNTTFGVATDSEGEFRLKLPAGGYDLVVTFTGYETESFRISNATEADKNLIIEVKPREKEMQEVSVVATNEVADGLQKYGQFFFDHFIGKSSFSRQCSLANPSVLKFYFSKKRNRLKVVAEEPLQIINNALGYNIKYSIDSFTYDYNTNTAFSLGYPLFEELTGTASQGVKWMENRKRAYNGSMLHFMRSLYRQSLTDEGFEVQLLANQNGTDKPLPIKNIYPALNFQRDDSLRVVQFLPTRPNIAVIYKKEKPEQLYLEEFDTKASDKIQVSLITINTKEPLIIEENGYYYDQQDLTFNGYWGFERVGDMVPFDFQE
jgi:hypothetical protein